MKYRRREIVDAIQFDYNNPQVETKMAYGCDRITVDLTGSGNHSHSEVKEILLVYTTERGWAKINNGDYIITNEMGEVSIMNKEKFESLYASITA